METPIILLKAAASEIEGQSRTLQVIKACKMITDTLPFVRKNFILLEEPELMTYLMICFPLNPRSIDMIMFSMIEKFQAIHTFLKEIWLGFTFIANMEETDQNFNRRPDTSSKVFQLGLRRSGLGQMRDYDDYTPSRNSRRPSYCREIERNKELIKLAVLNYVDKIIELYLYKLQNKVAFQPDIPGLMKAFLTHTPSEKVIIKACTIIEKVRRKDKKIPFDHEIEEILLSKKGALINVLPPQSRTNLESARVGSQKNIKTSRPEPIVSGQMGNNINIITTGSEKVGSINIIKLNENDFPDKQVTKNEIGSKTTHDESEYTDELDGQIREAEVEMLDDWLCEFEIKDVPLVTKDEDIKDIILKKRNFEAFLTFVFDPRAYSLSQKWRMIHDDTLEAYKEEDSQDTRTNDPTRLNARLQKLKDTRSLHAYVLRSYKVMQVICDIRNFKYIMQAQKDGLENFFMNMYVFCVAREEGSLCNFNHVAKIAEYFVRKEPNGSAHFLMRFNLIFKFLQNIVFQYVQHFFLTLFGCSEHVRDVDQDSIDTILKYCKLTSFFMDMANAILHGESTLDPKKFDVEYKPIGIGPLLKATSGESGFFFTPEERPICYDPHAEESYYVEELKGFSVDIDGLQNAIKSKKNIDLRKLKTLKTFMQAVNALSPVANKKQIKRYPSLMEKQYNSVLGETSKVEHSGDRKTSEAGAHFIPRRSSNALDPKIKHRKNSKSTSIYYDSSGLTSIMEGKANMTHHEIPQAQDPNYLTVGNLTNAQRRLQNFMQQGPVNPVKSTTSFNNSYGSTTASPNLVAVIRRGEKKMSLPRVESMVEGSQIQDRESFQEMSKGSISEVPSRGSQVGLKRMESGTDRLKIGTRELQHRYSKTSTIELRSSGKIREEYEDSPSIESRENKAPRKITLAYEMKTDTIAKSSLEQLNKLYPMSAKNNVVTDIDAEAKQVEFNASRIQANEPFSLAMCEMVEEMFRKAFVVKEKQEHNEGGEEDEEEKRKKKKYELNRKIGTNGVDYTLFWSTVLAEQCKFFEALWKNYLLKIKMNPLGQMNSGYTAGRIVNMVLKKCLEKNAYMEKYSGQILEICKKHFHYLCKMIIQSHAWEPRDDIRVFLQDVEVIDLLGTGRLLLVSTLSLILQNDQANNYEVLQHINDTCWHTLIVWFFNKKTNNVYQQLFFKILELAFLFTNEKFVLNLLFKINIVSYMYNIWTEMCQNNVLLKDNHIDSMLYHLKKIYNLVYDLAETRYDYKSLNLQLGSSISWKALEPYLLPPGKKKRNSILSNDHNRSRFDGRGSHRSPLMSSLSPKAGRNVIIKTVKNPDFSTQMSSPTSPVARKDVLKNASFHK